MTTPPSVRDASCAAVWAPWLAAPLFALLPIGGCAVAGLARSAVAEPSRAAHAAVAAAPATLAPAAVGILASDG